MPTVFKNEIKDLGIKGTIFRRTSGYADLYYIGLDGSAKYHTNVNFASWLYETPLSGELTSTEHYSDQFYECHDKNPRLLYFNNMLGLITTGILLVCKNYNVATIYEPMTDGAIMKQIDRLNNGEVNILLITKDMFVKYHKHIKINVKVDVAGTSMGNLCTDTLPDELYELGNGEVHYCVHRLYKEDIETFNNYKLGVVPKKYTYECSWYPGRIIDFDFYLWLERVEEGTVDYDIERRGLAEFKPPFSSDGRYKFQKIVKDYWYITSLQYGIKAGFIPDSYQEKYELDERAKKCVRIADDVAEFIHNLRQNDCDEFY